MPNSHMMQPQTSNPRRSIISPIGGPLTVDGPIPPRLRNSPFLLSSTTGASSSTSSGANAPSSYRPGVSGHHGGLTNASDPALHMSASGNGQQGWIDYTEVPGPSRSMSSPSGGKMSGGMRGDVPALAQHAAHGAHPSSYPIHLGPQTYMHSASSQSMSNGSSASLAGPGPIHPQHSSYRPYHPATTASPGYPYGAMAAASSSSSIASSTYSSSSYTSISSQSTSSSSSQRTRKPRMQLSLPAAAHGSAVTDSSEEDDDDEGVFGMSPSGYGQSRRMRPRGGSTPSLGKTANISSYFPTATSPSSAVSPSSAAYGSHY